MRAQESVENDEDLFEAAINAALSKLFGKPVGGASESSSAAGPATDIGDEASAWQASGSEMVLVRFSSIPEGATVLVDGKVACADTSKGCSRKIAAGVHTISMQMDKYEERTEVVKLDKSGDLSWKLQPRFGWLSVQTDPAGVALQLDGAPVGSSPLSRLEVNPGVHEVLVDDRCFVTAGKKLVISRDHEEQVALTLAARQGAIQVTAEDESGNAVAADVSVDGTKLGTAPGTFKVSVCVKELVVSGAGFAPSRLPLTVTERQRPPR